MTTSKGVALITGCAQGIGRGIALRLAEDGFDISLNDMSSKKDALDELAKTIQGLGRKTTIWFADVSAEEQVKDMVAHTVQALGSLDVMVANAGIFMNQTCITEVDQSLWDAMFAVNVRGVFLCFKHAGAQMVAQGRGGRLIAAASISGKTAFKDLSPYSASKFAVRGLCQAAALDLGMHGITANSYAPGAINTALLPLDANPDLRKSMEDKAALRTTGTPEDVANVVSFLASERSHFISGQSIGCDGGWVGYMP